MLVSKKSCAFGKPHFISVHSVQMRCTLFR